MKYRFLTLVVMAAVSRMALADNVTRVDLGSQVLRVPATGQTQIPLTAFYTPTGKPVEAGKVSAQAQFTIDYQ